jgi:hypothetical protein
LGGRTTVGFDVTIAPDAWGDVDAIYATGSSCLTNGTAARRRGDTTSPLTRKKSATETDVAARRARRARHCRRSYRRPADRRADSTSARPARSLHHWPPRTRARVIEAVWPSTMSPGTRAPYTDFVIG